MKIKLLLQAISRFLMGLIFCGLLLFLPAGTFKFWNAWLFIGLLFIPMIFVALILFIKNPKLLEKRLRGKEKENTQKLVILTTLVIFILGFIIAGLNFRFNWMHLPLWLIIFASIILLISYGFYAEVMRENTYLSRTVEVQENQKVIDTGLYGIIRHPMYSATIFLFLSIPLVLGSLYSFIIFLFIPFVLVKRIKNEEKILENGLEGYKEYKQKVKYRLIPFIW